ncbi:DUF6170 family protein [Rheinheimera sp. WS51]|uniref:DUF6170 family protein n=1 Tax=Rheinheimera sp. WS51 TaxID=3425886 RepID=UPI003D92B7C2
MLYFSSRAIPELEGLDLNQRMLVIRQAVDQLPVPTKVMLNIIKLLILTPLFLLIARSGGWQIVGYVVLLLISYPVITRPITFALCRSKMPAIRQKLFENTQQN